MADPRPPAARLADMCGPVNTSDPRSFAASPFSVAEVNNYPEGDPREPVHVRERGVEAVEPEPEPEVEVEVEVESGAPLIEVNGDGSTSHVEAGPGEQPETPPETETETEAPSEPEAAGEPVSESAPAVEPIPLPENVTALQKLTVDVLDALATQEGIQVDDPRTKVMLVTALREALFGAPTETTETTDAVTEGDLTVTEE